MPKLDRGWEGSGIAPDGECRGLWYFHGLLGCTWQYGLWVPALATPRQVHQSGRSQEALCSKISVNS